jgi:Histone H1-like nucleoprotein HC2/PASTA domain
MRLMRREPRLEQFALNLGGLFAEDEDMASPFGALIPRVVTVAIVALFATATLTFAAGAQIPTAAPIQPTVAPAVVKPPALIVPAVTGQAYVFAKGALEDAGFAWRLRSGSRGFAGYRVVSQFPAAGTSVVDTGAPTIVLRLAADPSYQHAGHTPDPGSPYAGTAVRLAGLASAPLAPASTGKHAAKRVTAKKLAAKKVVAKKVALKKPAAKKVTAKKVTVKKVAVKKPAAKKVVAKKVTVKKVAVKKPAAKKVVAKKVTVKKVTVKKPTAKKVVAKKVVVKKPAVKKPATRPAAKKVVAKKPQRTTATKAKARVKTRAKATRPPAFVLAGAKREPLNEMPLTERARLLAKWAAVHRQPTAANVQYWLYQHAWIVTGARFGWWHGAQALRTLVKVDHSVEREWGIGSRSEAEVHQALSFVHAHSA